MSQEINRLTNQSSKEDWEIAAMKLELENRKLRKALEFYKNPSDYVAPFTGGLGKLYFDCGTVAKEALRCEYSGVEK